MARVASNNLRVGTLALLGLLLGLANVWPQFLAADFREEERARVGRRVNGDLWQTVFGQRVVAEARRQLGRPYVWGGKTGDPGFDCSGYTAYVFNSLGVPLAASAWGQYQQGVEVEKAALRPGDLVFFAGRGSPLHVGIYAGDGLFLNAPGTGKVIESTRLDSAYFRPRFMGARRLVPDLENERRRRDRAKALAPSSIPPSQAHP